MFFASSVTTAAYHVTPSRRALCYLSFFMSALYQYFLPTKIHFPILFIYLFLNEASALICKLFLIDPEHYSKPINVVLVIFSEPKKIYTGTGYSQKRIYNRNDSMTKYSLLNTLFSVLWVLWVFIVEGSTDFKPLLPFNWFCLLKHFVDFIFCLSRMKY